MSDQLRTNTKAVPLLPLTTGVVLPGMVVTIPLDVPEARAAAEAARSQDRELLLVPRVASGYSRVGTVAKVEDGVRLPSGGEAPLQPRIPRRPLSTRPPATAHPARGFFPGTRRNKPV